MSVPIWSASEPLLDRPKHTLEPRGSVYSLLIYGPAVTRIRQFESEVDSNKRAVFLGHIRTRTVFGMALTNFIIQAGLLYVMSAYGGRDAVKEWIVTTDPNLAAQQDLQGYRKFRAKKESAGDVLSDDDMVVESDAVCTLHEGMYSCAPTMLRFTSEWDSLDKNGDGLWDIHEAEDRAGRIDKRRAIYFKAIIGSLHARALWLQQHFNKTLHLSQDVLTKRGIPKAYFDYWVGDAQFCSNYASATCKYIVASGLFDSALTKGKIAAEYKGIFGYPSAIDYCVKMLETHGSCENSLPPSYQKDVWKRHSVCGDMTLRPAGVMTNPNNKAEKFQVNEPMFPKIDAQERTTDGLFFFFMVVVMYIFLSSLSTEVKLIGRNADFIASFPALYNRDDSGGEDHGDDQPKRYSIERISQTHRAILAFTTFIRLCILLALAFFGSWFLLIQTSYLNLVLNAVALVFITDTDEMIYKTFLDPIDRKELGMHKNCKPIRFRGYVPHGDDTLGGQLCAKHTWGLVIVPLLAIVIVTYYQVMVRSVRIEALNCACLQSGPNCAESFDHKGEWWNHYWTRTLPAAIHHIESMRLQGS